MKLQKAAVIGHPIKHTMSPFIHKALFEAAGIEMQYSVLDIENIAEDIEILRSLDVFNVTIPHKENIISILDELDEKAAAFGAVNTVCVKNGKMTGHITDGAGCLSTIESEGVSTKGKTLILGSGGTARALAFELAYTNLNFDITLVHRPNSAEKANEISDDVKSFSGDKKEGKVTCVTYEMLENSDEKYDLMINATNVGMFPNADACAVSDAVISRCDAVFDAVFNPEQTVLLSKAEKLGKKAIKGIGMLVRQAAEAHKIWYGSEFAESFIKQLCNDAADEMNRIFYNK